MTETRAAKPSLQQIAEVIGKSLRELGMDLDPDAHEPAMQGLGDSGELRDLEWDLVAKDGRAVTCLISVVRLSIDGAQYDLVTAQDLSVQRQLERALLESVSLEQERLGRDLHDGLGQEFTGLSLLAAALASAERNAGRPADQLDLLDRREDSRVNLPQRYNGLFRTRTYEGGSESLRAAVPGDLELNDSITYGESMPLWQVYARIFPTILVRGHCLDADFFLATVENVVLE